MTFVLIELKKIFTSSFKCLKLNILKKAKIILKLFSPKIIFVRTIHCCMIEIWKYYFSLDKSFSGQCSKKNLEKSRMNQT